MSWWLVPEVGMALAYRRWWSPLEGSQCVKTASFPIKSTAFLYFPAGSDWAGKEPASIWNIGIVSTSRELANCFKEYYWPQIPSTSVCAPSLCSSLECSGCSGAYGIFTCQERFSFLLCLLAHDWKFNKDFIQLQTEIWACTRGPGFLYRKHTFRQTSHVARSTNWATEKLTHRIWFSWLQWSHLRCSDSLQMLV